MILSSFILDNLEEILQCWEDFAKSLSSGKHLDIPGLRDHAEAVLRTIAEDMLTTQSDAQQEAKSQGMAPRLSSDTEAERHGLDRAVRGFDINEMYLEFRALRASVIRLWGKSAPSFRSEALEELTRFNEGLDQALGESIERFTKTLDGTRELFLAVLGHDLRTPIGAIMLSAENMHRTPYLSPDDVKVGAARILRSGSRMNQMVEDVVDMTRYRLDGKLPVHRMQVDVSQLCQQVVDESAAYHPKRILRYQSNGHLFAELDQSRVARLMSNLVENAIRHGAADSPVTVAAVNKEGWIVLTVHNVGPVIPASEIRVIFDPLTRRAYRGKDEPRYVGLGLGLYIVRTIAQAHGGAVTVSSDQESGTTFTVRLPQ